MIRPLIPAILWTVIVLLLTGLPGNVMPEVPRFLDLFQPDKLVHIFIFGLWVVLAAYGTTELKIRKGLLKNASLFSAVLGMIFGGITEILQYSVIPQRSGNIYDFIADAVGCLLGYIFFTRFWQKKRSKVDS